MYAILTQIKDRLAALAGVESCKIGLEPDIAPSDYPIVRVVPTRMFPGEPAYRSKMEVLVYYGDDLTEYEGLDTVYARLFEMEAAIRNTLRLGDGWAARFKETLTDEDRLAHYKLFASRFEVEA